VRPWIGSAIGVSSIFIWIGEGADLIATSPNGQGVAIGAFMMFLGLSVAGYNYWVRRKYSAREQR
jgi:hypothetical protein